MKFILVVIISVFGADGVSTAITTVREEFERVGDCENAKALFKSGLQPLVPNGYRAPIGHYVVASVCMIKGPGVPELGR